MRVLLPLRKLQANTQSSNSSLSDYEEEGHREAESITESETDQPHEVLGSVPPEIIEVAEVDSTAANFKPRAQQQLELQHHQPKPPSKPPSQVAVSTGPWKTTGLQTPSEPSVDNPSRQSSLFPRKRRPSVDGGDSKLCKKRPALDKKPPARDLGSTMVGGGRRPNWLYRDDNSRRDSTETPTRESLENDPASAQGESINDDRDMDYYLTLKKRGLEVREQEGDGNCLFRAVSLQVYGDPSMHGDVRKQCMDFMDRDKEHFSQFVTGEPFQQYIQRKRQDGVHGNNPEIQAISELFNRPLEVFCPENGATPLNIFHAEYKTDDAPIRLSYHDGNHYNAVVDPLVPTAGLGLGLPGLQPGLADKMQVAQAVKESDAAADQMELKKALKESEDDELQRAIKESKLSAEHRYSNVAMALSDMDATYFELEQAALERSLEPHSNFEQGKKQKASSSRRRKHGRDSPASHVAAAAASGGPISSELSPQSAVASLPSSASGANKASLPPVAAAASSVASVASASACVAAKSDEPPPAVIGAVDEYPQTVQELVMNGFDLKKVVRAYELIGDNFEDLIAFLVSNTG